MSYGLGTGRQRQQRQRRGAMMKWLFALVIIFGAGYFAYDTGTDLAREEVVSVSETLEDAKREIAELKKQKDDLYVANQQLRRSEAAMKARLAKEAPTGARRSLLDGIDQRLDSGIKAERLAAVIKAVQNERICEGEPVTRRFLVRTPIHQGGSDSVDFAAGAITVTATGASAQSESGGPEAWFDPAKPVNLRLTRLGGDIIEAAGLLPLHTSMPIDDTDYRFSITATERQGFVTVTGQGCRYP